MKKTIFLAIAIAAVCSCNKNQIEQTIDNSATSDSTISFDASVSENLTKSGETEMIPFASEEIEGIYSASLQVMPIGAMADTKATINTGSNEITRETLKTSGFYVDGYLDPSTEEYAGDTERDGNNGIFYAKHTTFDPNIEDCAHTVHNDGHWVFEGTAPKWRDLSDHHFWAYYPKQTFTESAYNAVSFDFTSDNTTDLVMAHHEQYWEMHDDADNHGTNDELWCLNFKHPLAAVHLAKNFTFKYHTTAAETDADLKEDTDGSRFELTTFNMMGYNSGSCEVSDYEKNIDFDWTVDNNGGVESMVELCEADASGASYVVPQGTSNIMIPITVLDKGTGLSFDDTWELPSTNVISNWEPGYYYNYSYKATFIGQFVDPDIPPVYDPGFKGKTEQAATPVGTLNFSRINELTIKWKGMPMVNNHKQVTYLIISPYEIPVEIKDDGRPEIIMSQLESKTGQASFDALHDGNGELVLLGMSTSGSKECIMHPSTNSNITTKYGPAANGFDTYTTVSEGQNLGVISEENQYGVIMKLNVANLNLSGRQYIYLLCYDGSEATTKTNWPIKEFTISIDSRR